MNIKFVAKNVKLTGALKAFIEKQLKSIEKISGDIIGAEAFVSQQKQNFKVEIIVKTRQHSYHAEDKSQILKQAVRETLNALKSQIKKNKEKLKMEKKRVNKRSFREKFLRLGRPEPEKKVSQSQITISDNFSRKPLSIEEAIFFLKESGENAYLFTNVENSKISVVFFNRNDEISIIESSQK